MTREAFVNYIEEKIQEITEEMNDTPNKNSVYFGILSGELGAYKHVIATLLELEEIE